MAVAKEQIGEIQDILEIYIPNQVERIAMIAALKKTTAYKENQSFRETIELLTQKLINGDKD
jgi:hypothetical protein